jgi:23S rRNA (pseudouridine1915-N3)-methyltransferase
MKLRAVWIGKTKSVQLAEVSLEYISRIRHFLPIEITEAKEPKGDGERRIEAEGEKLLAALSASDRVIALDPKGKSWTSIEFAKFLQKHMSGDARTLTFVIGGHSGLSGAVKNRADLLWSLSPLTFTHDLSRVVLLEQVYRALTIIHNLPYSK